MLHLLLLLPPPLRSFLSLSRGCRSTRGSTPLAPCRLPRGRRCGRGLACRTHSVPRVRSPARERRCIVFSSSHDRAIGGVGGRGRQEVSWLRARWRAGSGLASGPRPYRRRFGCFLRPTVGWAGSGLSSGPRPYRCRFGCFLRPIVAASSSVVAAARRLRVRFRGGGAYHSRSFAERFGAAAIPAGPSAGRFGGVLRFVMTRAAHGGTAKNNRCCHRRRQRRR